MTVQHVRVGDLVELHRRAVEVEPDAEYREVGVRSFGRGIFHKEPIAGTDLGSKRVFRIEPGDLVISNVFAWEGAIAVASEAEEGMIGSHRFMTFRPKDDRTDTAWLAWFFLSEPGLEMIRRASPGSAGRNRTLAIERFEALEIPLPPVDEQRDAARRVGTTADASSAVAELTRRAQELSDALAVSLSARPDLDEGERLRAGWQKLELSSVMVEGGNKVKVEPGNAYPNLGILSYGRGVFEKPDIEGSRTSAAVLNQVRSGQFIYSRLFAFEGAYAYVPPEFDGRFVSNEFPTFDPNPDLLDARWLANCMRSPSRWAELRGSSKGLGVRRQRVPVEAILSYRIWLPPIETQKSMVAAIERIESIQAARVDVDRRTAALVPAELNRAFAEIK